MSYSYTSSLKPNSSKCFRKLLSARSLEPSRKRVLLLRGGAVLEPTSNAWKSHPSCILTARLRPRPCSCRLVARFCRNKERTSKVRFSDGIHQSQFRMRGGLMNPGPSAAMGASVSRNRTGPPKARCSAVRAAAASTGTTGATPIPFRKSPLFPHPDARRCCLKLHR